MSKVLKGGLEAQTIHHDVGIVSKEAGAVSLGKLNTINWDNQTNL